MKTSNLSQSEKQAFCEDMLRQSPIRALVYAVMMMILLIVDHLMSGSWDWGLLRFTLALMFLWIIAVPVVLKWRIRRIKEQQDKL